MASAARICSGAETFGSSMMATSFRIALGQFESASRVTSLRPFGRPFGFPDWPGRQGLSPLYFTLFPLPCLWPQLSKFDQMATKCRERMSRLWSLVVRASSDIGRVAKSHRGVARCGKPYFEMPAPVEPA